MSCLLLIICVPSNSPSFSQSSPGLAHACPVELPLDLGRHACRTNLPRKMFKSIRTTVWKTRKRIRKTIRNAIEKCLAPLRPTKIFSPPIFHQILKVFHRPNLHKKKFFFTARLCRGGHAKLDPKLLQNDVFLFSEAFDLQLQIQSCCAENLPNHRYRFSVKLECPLQQRTSAPDRIISVYHRGQNYYKKNSLQK